MKSIIIYYSLSGNVKLLSEAMAQEIGAELLPLIPEKDVNPGSFSKYFWGGRQVIMKEKPLLKPINFNPAEYDLIIIGTPVWVSNYAPAVRTFLTDNPISGKKVALFCSHESAPGQTIINLQAALSANQIMAAADFFSPLKKDKEIALDRARAWVKNLI